MKDTSNGHESDPVLRGGVLLPEGGSAVEGQNILISLLRDVLKSAIPGGGYTLVDIVGALEIVKAEVVNWGRERAQKK